MVACKSLSLNEDVVSETDDRVDDVRADDTVLDGVEDDRVLDGVEDDRVLDGVEDDRVLDGVEDDTILIMNLSSMSSQLEPRNVFLEELLIEALDRLCL